MSEAVVYGVASGKGGVGKSMLSVLLAAQFARTGDRVLLFDGAAGEGNLRFLLGALPLADSIDAPALCSSENQPAPIAERLWFLPSERGPGGRASRDPTERARAHLRRTGLFDLFDTVVVDSGPGLDGALRATIRCTRLLVVAVPEAASLYSAYALLKSVDASVPGLSGDLVVNRVREEVEAARTHEILGFACRRYLGRELRHLGSVPERPELHRSTQVPGRLLHERCAGVEALVETLRRLDAAGREGRPAYPAGASREAPCRH